MILLAKLKEGEGGYFLTCENRPKNEADRCNIDRQIKLSLLEVLPYFFNILIQQFSSSEAMFMEKLT